MPLALIRPCDFGGESSELLPLLSVRGSPSDDFCAKPNNSNDEKSVFAQFLMRSMDSYLMISVCSGSIWVMSYDSYPHQQIFYLVNGFVKNERLPGGTGFVCHNQTIFEQKNLYRETTDRILTWQPFDWPLRVTRLKVQT